MSENLVSGAQRTLGNNLKIGPLGFGCWRLTGTSDANNASLISAALDAGMNLVDNADVYGLDWGGTGFGACEEALGRVLAANSSLRNRIVLATKGGIIPGVPYDSSAQYLVKACEASLTRMQVEHVELYQIHRPDMFTHPEEVASAFASLKNRGLVSAFGVSNYTPAQTRALAAHVEEPLVSTQVEFSAAQLAPMRDGTFDLCMETNTAALAWSPLAGGRIATGQNIPQELLTTLDELAVRENTIRTVIATAFVLAHPVKAVAILGTQQIERLTELGQATAVTLTREDVYRIVVASEGVPLP
jgi:predicted oxidoreductase